MLMALGRSAVVGRRRVVAGLWGITLARCVLGEAVVALGSGLGGCNTLLRARVRKTRATN